MLFRNTREVLRLGPVRAFVLGVCPWLALAIAVYGQQARRTPNLEARPRSGGRNLTSTTQFLEETGFRQIFDSKTLNGWDGDPNFWRVENETIVGEATADKQPKHNTFLIWRGGNPANFELKLQYRLTGFNSGIQYRSVELPDIRWAMKGYQADMDGAQAYTGQIYEERGRGFLALRGQFTYLEEGKKPHVIGSVGNSAELKTIVKAADWNDLHVLARDNMLIQVLNGHVMCMLVDEDKTNRRMDGLIGIQLHVGPPTKIEVRNVRIKNL
jgi:hypothetical protein